MRFFKLSLQTGLLAALLLGLAACSLPSPEKRELEDSASFFLDRAEGKFTTTTNHAKFSIPVTRTLSFKACFKSNSKSQSILNHEFEIEAATGAKRATTDGTGCLVWEEEIEFNGLADAKYLLLERQVRSLGRERGARKVSLVVNPWTEQVYSLNDSRVNSKSYVSGKQAALALKGDGQEKIRSLWIDDLRVSSEEKRLDATGLHLNFELRAALKYEHLDENGSRKLIDLTKGSFKARFSLIHVVAENGKETRRFLYKNEEMIDVPELMNGSLALQSPVLLQRICTRGQVLLGLSLTPVGAPAGLRGFEGVFFLGECDQIKGAFFARLKTEPSQKFYADKNYTVETFVEEGAPDPKIQETPNQQPPTQSQTNDGGRVEDQDYYQPARIEIPRIDYTSVGFQGQRTVERERTFDAAACLRMGLDRRDLRGQVFQVTKLNGETREIRSLDDGCLTWQDSVKFNVFAPECWSKKQIRIRNANLGMDQTFDLLVNPWTDSPAPVRDLRRTSADQAREGCASGESELVTLRYDFEKLYFRYGLDEFLNLEVRKHGPFRISMTLKRPSLTNPAGFAEEPVPVGSYLLRLAVVDITVDDYAKAEGKVFTAFEKVVSINGASTISQELELATKNVKAMGNTNQVVIEVLPLRQDAAALLARNPGTPIDSLIDASIRFKTLTYRGPLLMANNQEGGTLTLVPNSGASVVKRLIQQFQRDQIAYKTKMAAMSKTAHYARVNKLTLINLHDERSSQGFRASLGNPLGFLYPDSRDTRDSRPVTVQELKDLIDKGIDENLRSKLCVFWFNDFWQRPLPGKQHGILLGGRLASAGRMLTMECHRLALRDVRSMFDIETKIFPKGAVLKEAQDGFFRDFNVNQSFSLGRSYSDSVTHNWGWDVSAGLRTPDIPGLRMFGISTGVHYSLSRSQTTSDSWSTGVNYSNSINVQLETLRLKIAMDGYEKCLVIKLNPHLFIARERSFWSGENPWVTGFHPDLTAQEREHYARSGYMICEGQPRAEKTEMTETYYVMNQFVPGGQVLDNATENNRPFFVALRGERDLTSFLSYLLSSQEIPKSFEAEFLRGQIQHDPASPVFLRGIPNYPGVITPR